MEFCVEKVCGTSAHTRDAVAGVLRHADGAGQPAYVACAGAGAVLVPLAARSTPSARSQRFYYHAPRQGPSDLIAAGSPKGSPEPGTAANRLVRVNKAGCVAASTASAMVAVGEAGGYMPRLLLYDLASGDCLSVLRDQHQFGVQHIRFSPSGTHLASIGTPQDGFLYVWSVAGGQFELQASNRCISEVHDLVWLNNDQLVTVGVRHIKLWTVGSESILPGRSVLLRDTLDQTFECACPAAGPLRGGMLVGTARGEVYKMPEVELLAELSPREAVTSIVALDAAFVHVLVSTQSRIYEFRKSFASGPTKTYSYGTAALFSLGSDLYFLARDDVGSGRVLRLPASQDIPFDAIEDPEAAEEQQDLQLYKNMQLRSNPEGTVVLWRAGEPFVHCWPHTRFDIPFSDITTAYAPTVDSFPMAGSLCGDLYFGGQLLNAHNGPITDVDQLGAIAISAGRDRTVQVWQHVEPEDQPPYWKLRQTLVFTSPVLKAKLCARLDGAYALVCCAANKTAYFYTVDSPGTAGVDVDAPLFADSPRSLLLKGMPFDMAALGEDLVLSTNDKHVSVLDPFAETENVKQAWRAFNANAESVNLTHVEIISRDSARYVLAAGSDKCVHLFTFPKGVLVASQWGHGDPIAGVAWTGSEVLSASESIMVSSLHPTSDSSGVERPRLGRSRSSTMTDAPQAANLPPSPTLPRFVIPSSAQPTVSTSPPRKVYNASVSPPRPRSVSPQRMAVPPRGLTRSPSPARPASPTRPPSPARERPASPRRSEPSLGPSAKDATEKQGGLAYKPLRLATPSTQARNIAAASAAASAEKQQDPTAHLEEALQQFVEQPLSQHDTAKLRTLLVSALNKVDGFSLVEEFSERLCGSIEARLENKLAELLKRT